MSLPLSSERLLLFHLIWWLMLFEHPAPVQSYRSPDEYYFSIGKDENLYDTGTLPEGEDVTVYLFRDEPKSYFLPLDGQSSPVSITVVPCSSVIEWKVYFHAQDNPVKRESLEGDPLFLQEGKSGSTAGSPLQGGSASTNSYLHTFQGRDMTTFKTNGHLPKGIIRLVLTSKESNSRVQIYASGARQTDLAIPLLPDNTAIEIAANDKNSVTVAWQQSPSHKQWGQHVHYCVTFNPRRNYRTLCSVYADLEGEIPPAWPKYAGFGFRWEDAAKKRISSIRRQYESASGAPHIRRDIHMECVGNRHWASVTSLLSGRRYHVDVFAINRLTNRSSSYNGTSFVTASRPPLPTLKTGRLLMAYVGGSVGPQITYEHQLKTFAKKLVLFVQTCSRGVSIDLIYDGAIVLRQIPVNAGLRKFVLKNADPGKYRVRLNLNVEDAPRVPVKLCLVGKAKKCPYSGTPNHRIINATTNLSSCRSVTLQWHSADAHAKYCLYAVTSTQTGSDDETFFEDEEHDCGSSGIGPAQSQTDGEKLIFCRIYKKTSPQRIGNKIVETVWDLKTKTKYNFRLQVVLKKGVTVDYEPVSVDTEEEDKC